MKLPLLHLLANNAFRKVFSLIIAYALWSGISSHREYEQTFGIPIVFFGAEQEQIIQAPESLEITIRATRKELHSLDRSALAAHIDSDRISQGTHIVPLTSVDLLLPQNIKLVNYVPSNIIITKQLPSAEKINNDA